MASLRERSGMRLTRISVVTLQRPYVCTIEEYFTVSSAHQGVACGETPMRHAFVESEMLNAKCEI